MKQANIVKNLSQQEASLFAWRGHGFDLASVSLTRTNPAIGRVEAMFKGFTQEPLDYMTR